MNSEFVCKWLTDHPLIKVRALAVQIGVSPQNFDKYIKTNTLPEKYLGPVIEALKPYGISIDVPTLSRQKPIVDVENGQIVFKDPLPKTEVCFPPEGTDSSPALQKMLDEANKPQTLVIPKGNYTFNTDGKKSGKKIALPKKTENIRIGGRGAGKTEATEKAIEKFKEVNPGAVVQRVKGYDEIRKKKLGL